MIVNKCPFQPLFLEQARHDHGTSSNANCIPIGYDFEAPENKKIIYPNELGLGMDRLAIKIQRFTTSIAKRIIGKQDTPPLQMHLGN